MLCALRKSYPEGTTWVTRWCQKVGWDLQARWRGKVILAQDIQAVEKAVVDLVAAMVGRGCHELQHKQPSQVVLDFRAQLAGILRSVQAKKKEGRGDQAPRSEA